MKDTIQLLPHQVEGLSRSWGNKGFALFMDMGTGKTLTALAWKFYNQYRKTLIILRRDDFITWKGQIEQFTNYTAQYIKGTPAKKKELLKQEGFDLYLISYDSFATVKRMIPLLEFDSVICDESTKLKRHKSNRFKFIKRFTERISHRMILTGTPSTNSIDNLFSQFLFLDNGRRLGSNYYHFREKYYTQLGPFESTVTQSSLAKIRQAISDISYVVKSDECLRLPPEVNIVKEAIMTPIQQRYYKSVKDNWEIFLEDGPKSILTEYVIAKISKLLQISSGFMYDEDHEVHYFDSGKEFTLKEMLLDELQSFNKIVIWYTFKAELTIITKVLDSLGMSNYVIYNQDKEKSRRDFYSNTKVRFFIAPEASGIGMNELVVSPVAVYYSNSIKLEDRLQSMKRIRRKGSEGHKQIFYYDIVTANSKDLDILNILKSNEDVLSYILKMTDGQYKDFLSR